MEKLITGSECKHQWAEHKATRKAPFIFADSGLSNVHLTGIKYWTCDGCADVKVQIPAVQELMNALARALVKKRSPLNHHEIKFLRKRLGMKAADFAAMTGVTAEQFSRWENAHNLPSDSADRLIRVAYSLVSKDKQLIQLVQKFQQWSTSIQGSGANEVIVAERTRRNEWCAEAELEHAA